MKTNVWVLTCLLFLLCFWSAHGQTNPSSNPTRPAGTGSGIPKICSDRLGDLHKARAETGSQRDGDIKNAVHDLLHFGENSSCFAQLLVDQLGQSPEFRNDLPSTFADFLKVLETQRSDKQAGSSTGTGGTTNLVSKGLAAQTLSVATEYGAITESVNKQIVTVQGSLGGLASPLIRENLLQYCGPGAESLPGTRCAHQGDLNQLSKFSFGISFDTSAGSQAISATPSGSSSGTAQPVTFTAGGHEISSWTARYAILNRADTTSKAFQQTWVNGLSPSSAGAGGGAGAGSGGAGAGAGTGPGTGAGAGAGGRAAGGGGAGAAGNANSAGAPTKPVCPEITPNSSSTYLQLAATAAVSALNTLMNSLHYDTDPQIADWLNKSTSELEKKAELDAKHESNESVDQDWQQLASSFLGIAKERDPDLLRQVIDLIQANSLYRFEQYQYVACISQKPVLTLEYDGNRVTGEPFTSVIRVIYDEGIGSKWSITANGGFEVYNSTPSSSIPGASRVRDAQVGIEVDWKFLLPSQSTTGKGKGGTRTGLGAIFANLSTPTLSGTYYFQHQVSPAILKVTPGMPFTGITLTGLPSNASQVFAKKGNISIGQLRLTLGSGSARVPFAISYSNRTELITKPEWKAQIGISYDFDSLFASAGSGKTTQ